MTEGPLLVIDTATTRATVALGRADGTLAALEAWDAGYRHGEELLGRVERALESARIGVGDVGAIVVGTGPGAFTGLRVGLATAKALAHATRSAIVGVPTADALIAAVRACEALGDATGVALLLPAGPSDRTLCRSGEPPRLLPGGTAPDERPDEIVAAVDLPGRADPQELARGERAREDLAVRLLRLGAARLAATGGDDLTLLVPEYVTLPRGVRADLPDDVVRLAGTR